MPYSLARRRTKGEYTPRGSGASPAAKAAPAAGLASDPAPAAGGFAVGAPAAGGGAPQPAGAEAPAGAAWGADPAALSAPWGSAAASAASAASTAMGVPTGTVAPSFTRMACSTPLTGEGISVLTLSVMTSTRGSYFSTRSPTAFSHAPMVPSTTLSPSWGMVTVVRDIANASPPGARSGPDPAWPHPAAPPWAGRPPRAAR